MEEGKCMESISDFGIADDPISKMFHLCCYLLAQLDFLATAFCLSLEGMTQRTALDVKRFVMSVDLEDLGEMGTLSVQSGSFLQGL
jgi:hypothetical protein